MKKFWNLMLAALVIIGATACTENYENIENAESFSFYAEIGDDTRATIEKDGDVWKTTFEGGETLMVNGYKFTNTKEEPGKFTCTAVGVSKLAGANVTITTDGNHHSLQGKAAFNATATVENFGAEPVKLQALTSFFRFTYNGEGNVVLTLSDSDFKTDANTTASSITVTPVQGDNFVAFWPDGNKVTLSYTANGAPGKSKEVDLVAGKVYNLGDIVAPKVSTTWGIAGGFNNWAAGSPEPLFEIGNALVAFNLTNLNSGFKFVQNKGWDNAYGAVTSFVANALMSAGTDGGNIVATSTSAYDVYFYPASAIYCVVSAGSSAPALDKNKLYLVPNSEWRQSNARFAAYFFGNGEKWVSMSNNNGIYEVAKQSGYPSVIFCRMNPSATANNWNNKWNQTQDLTVPADNGDNIYTMTAGSWEFGTWSKL